MTHRRRRILSNALTLGLVAAGVVAMPAAAQARPLLRIHLAQVAAAWGDNEYGNLGDGTFVQRPAAVNVGSNVTQVAAGYDHSLAIIPTAASGAGALTLLGSSEPARPSPRRARSWCPGSAGPSRR